MHAHSFFWTHDPLVTPAATPVRRSSTAEVGAFPPMSLVRRVDATRAEDAHFVAVCSGSGIRYHPFDANPSCHPIPCSASKWIYSAYRVGRGWYPSPKEDGWKMSRIFSLTSGGTWTPAAGMTPGRCKFTKQRIQSSREGLREVASVPA